MGVVAGRRIQGLKTVTARWFLIGIILVALGIYLWGIQKNLPYTSEVDESIFVKRAVNMASSGNMNPNWFGNPGSTIFYPLTLIYHVWYAVTQQGEFFQPNSGLQLRYNQSPAEFYLLGRFLSVAYAIMSIPLLYLLGRKAFGKPVGLLGAWLFVFYPLAISQSQLVRTDSVAVFLGVLSLWLCLKVYEQPTPLNQLLLGLSIGLSIASRYFMGVLIPIFLIVNIAVFWRRNRNITGEKVWVAAIIGILAIGASFVLSTPYFFLSFEVVLKNLLKETRETHLGADGLSPVENLIWYLTRVIPANITWPQTILLALSIPLIIFKKSFPQLLLVGFMAIFLVGISASSLHWPRWIVQTLPIFALYVVSAIETLANQFLRYLKNPAWQNNIIIVGVMLVSIWPVYQSILLGIRQDNPSTRILAREWILQNLPPGSRIAQEDYTAPLNGTGFKLFKNRSLATTGYTLSDAYRGGYRYMIASSEVYGRYLAEPERYPNEVNFYENLFERGKLLKKFDPSDIQSGPVILIFELTQP